MSVMLQQGAEGDKAIATAVQDPQKFVLKPQREGGGVFIFLGIRALWSTTFLPVTHVLVDMWMSAVKAVYKR